MRCSTISFHMYQLVNPSSYFAAAILYNMSVEVASLDFSNLRLNSCLPRNRIVVTISHGFSWRVHVFLSLPAPIRVGEWSKCPEDTNLIVVKPNVCNRKAGSWRLSSSPTATRWLNLSTTTLAASWVGKRFWCRCLLICYGGSHLVICHSSLCYIWS